MTLSHELQSSLPTAGVILAAMTLIALVEAAIPLHVRGRWHRLHLGPNLAFTCLTIATALFLNAALVLLLVWVDARELGILRWAGLGPVYAGVVAVLALDFSFYVAHVAMHKVPVFWRVHRVHHADPVVDVTTSLRQHPAEGLIRYAFLAAFAATLGVGLGAFAVYRAASALNALLEHANVRAPRRLDGALSLVTTWPYMHKVHHSRAPHETDSNYGNLFSWFDRLLGTYTPSRRGETVACGLDGFDEPSTQSTMGLLALPLREIDRPNDATPAPSAAG